MNLRERILNKCKSMYVNYKVFPKEIAKKQPLYISYQTKCMGLRQGCIELRSKNIYPGMIQFGIKASVGLHGSEQSYLTFSPEAKLIFYGKADLSKGISLNVYESGLMEIGDNLFANGVCMIRCRHHVTVGDNNMWGWNVMVMDGDGHPIRNEDGQIMNHDRPISIGNNVWLGAYSKVLKGANIKDGCIVGLGSTVTGRNEHENSVLVGTPARECKNNVSWDRGEFPKEDEA